MMVTTAVMAPSKEKIVLSFSFRFVRRLAFSCFLLFSFLLFDRHGPDISAITCIPDFMNNKLFFATCLAFWFSFG